MKRKSMIAKKQYLKPTFSSFTIELIECHCQENFGCVLEKDHGTVF